MHDRSAHYVAVHVSDVFSVPCGSRAGPYFHVSGGAHFTCKCLQVAALRVCWLVFGGFCALLWRVHLPIAAVTPMQLSDAISGRGCSRVSAGGYVDRPCSSTEQIQGACCTPLLIAPRVIFVSCVMRAALLVIVHVLVAIDRLLLCARKPRFIVRSASRERALSDEALPALDVLLIAHLAQHKKLALGTPARHFLVDFAEIVYLSLFFFISEIC